ncbi:MAG: hypothetical protein KW802_02190 [Candidatus Doudnabacteria bacterium]|nr:hypothetical protein [Candidatus Doudnabacteria bacterium]
MNQEWHDGHPFPEQGAEAEKEQWRLSHKENCNCSKMMLPYRRTSRDEK